jgi:uncharacterized membrane protein (UPF0182 family)
VILPIGDSILYVQPLFVQAENVGNPELKKVALVLGEKVVLSDSFDEALNELFGIDSGGGPGPSPSPSPSGPNPSPSPSPSGNDSGNAELKRIIAKAGRLYEKAQQALADGRFGEYGDLIEKVGRLLERAQALSD